LISPDEAIKAVAEGCTRAARADLIGRFSDNNGLRAHECEVEICRRGRPLCQRGTRGRETSAGPVVIFGDGGRCGGATARP